MIILLISIFIAIIIQIINYIIRKKLLEILEKERMYNLRAMMVECYEEGNDDKLLDIYESIEKIEREERLKNKKRI